MKFIKKFLSIFFTVFSFFRPAACFTHRSVGSLIDKQNNVFDKSQEYLAVAKAVFASVQNTTAYKDLVDGKEVEMPISIPNAPNPAYELKLDSIVITPDYAYAVTFCD